MKERYRQRRKMSIDRLENEDAQKEIKKKKK